MPFTRGDVQRSTKLLYVACAMVAGFGGKVYDRVVPAGPAEVRTSAPAQPIEFELVPGEAPATSFAVLAMQVKYVKENQDKMDQKLNHLETIITDSYPRVGGSK